MALIQHHRRAQRYNPYKHVTYTMVDELMASTTQPMPQVYQDHQIGVMRAGLAAIERADTPTNNDWRVVSDAVNLMETLITCGPWRTLDGDLADVQDPRALLQDAICAMALAGARKLQEGKNIRLYGHDLVAVRGLLDDYADMLAALPHRTMVQAHRMTERRLKDILAGKRKPHDVEVVAL